MARNYQMCRACGTACAERRFHADLRGLQDISFQRAAAMRFAFLRLNELGERRII